MEKRNVLQSGRTICDVCGRTAVEIRSDRSRCNNHSGMKGTKQAGADAPLKSAAIELSKLHK
jgi:hypothetical protein